MSHPPDGTPPLPRALAPAQATPTCQGRGCCTDTPAPAGSWKTVQCVIVQVLTVGPNLLQGPKYAPCLTEPPLSCVE
jgi:hypothetical protein